VTTRRLKPIAVLAVAVLLAALAGVVAYRLADDKGVALAPARAAGARQGAHDGRAQGAKDGYRAGLRTGREQAFQRAHDQAYVRAYRRAFISRGLPAPACSRPDACRPASR
jgi:hypothetical protein